MRELKTINLTDSQKKVLARIIAAPSPKVATNEIVGNRNLVAARDELIKLGVIEVQDDETALTQSGQELAVDNNIADPSGELTPDGQALAYDEQAKEPAGGNAAMMGGGAPMPGGAGMGEEPLMMSYSPRRESLSLLRELLYPKN